jgi:hypothetical protein
MKSGIFLLAVAAHAAFPAQARTAEKGQRVDMAAPAAATRNRAIREVFFADQTMTLRPKADVRAGWAALSAEDQRIVQRECTATRSGDMGAATPDETGTARPDPSAPPLAHGSTGKAGRGVAAGEISLSHPVQICAPVDRMQRSARGAPGQCRIGLWRGGHAGAGIKHLGPPFGTILGQSLSRGVLIVPTLVGAEFGDPGRHDPDSRRSEGEHRHQGPGFHRSVLC